MFLLLWLVLLFLQMYCEHKAGQTLHEPGEEYKHWQYRANAAGILAVLAFIAWVVLVTAGKAAS